jgi:hypothetical protein
MVMQMPARMPSGPSPSMGAGMPNKMDQLRMGAERTLPSMPPPPRPQMPAGRGAPAPGGGIAALMGRPSAPAPSPMGRGAPSAPPRMGNAPMGGGMRGGEEGGGPQEQDLVVGIALTANEIAGGSPRRAIAMLDQAKQILMQNMGGEEQAPEGGDRLAELLG